MDVQREPESQLVDLREFVGILRRRKLIVIVTTLLVALLAVGLVSRRTPMYSATSRVEVRPLTAESSQYTSFYDLQTSMDTEAEKVTSTDVSNLAATMGAPVGASVSTSVPANTTLIDITCTSVEPAEAQKCATAYAAAYVQDRKAFAQSIYTDATKAPQEQIKSVTEQMDALTNKIRNETDPAIRQEYITELGDLRQQRAGEAVLGQHGDLSAVGSGTVALPSRRQG